MGCMRCQVTIISCLRLYLWLTCMNADRFRHKTACVNSVVSYRLLFKNRKQALNQVWFCAQTLVFMWLWDGDFSTSFSPLVTVCCLWYQTSPRHYFCLLHGAVSKTAQCSATDETHANHQHVCCKHNTNRHTASCTVDNLYNCFDGFFVTETQIYFSLFILQMSGMIRWHLSVVSPALAFCLRVNQFK